jgi:hypothetical protein
MSGDVKDKGAQLLSMLPANAVNALLGFLTEQRSGQVVFNIREGRVAGAARRWKDGSLDITETLQIDSDV